MHLTPKFKGLSSIIGGCLIHLVLGSFYLWGSINLYAASYFKFNFDSFLSIEQTLIVFPLMSLSLHTTAPISVKICEKLGMRLHCYIFGIGIFILVFLSSYAKSFWYFVAFYSIGFGFCSGLIYLIPMYNAYKFFPEHRGLISGVITGSYGLGTIISNNIFLIALNPNNRQPFLHTDGNYYFSADISNRLPYGIKILSIYFLIMIVIGTSLLFEYEDEPEEVVVNVCSSEENIKEFLLEMVDEPVESSRSIMNEKIISKSKRSSPQLCRASIEINYFQRQEKHKNPVYKSDIVLSGIKKRALFGSNIVKWSFRTQLPTDEANCESLSQALKSRSFYQIIFLLYCSSMGGFFLASNYKNYGSMGALFNGGGRLIWGIFLDKYSFKNVYIVLILIQSIVLFTLNLISLYKISYLFWICIGLACEGGHFVLFPPLTIKVLGAYVGAQAYGILFYGFCLANLSQFGITYWFKNEMGYENELYFFGTFTIIAGISVIFFKINANSLLDKWFRDITRMNLTEKVCLNPCKRDRAELTRQQAFSRSQFLSKINYILQLQVDKFSAVYNISTKITFEIDNINDIFLEYSGKYLYNLKINGFNIDSNILNTIWADNYLKLNKELLKIGVNELDIVSKAEFSSDGTGLFSFIEGSSQYIYSLFASNNCHKVFPCFDQPDLKSIFSLTIICPKKWECISNEPVQEILIKDEYKICKFFTSRKISTYLFAIIMGDFTYVESPLINNHNSIPLRLYCKESSIHELENSQKEIFNLTNFGLKFYENFFQTSFPFSKYDQIFCPEFNFLGMENPGAVCLTDYYLFCDIVTSDKRTQRCLTIIHELAHMWFGNLVTMKWWDDIWLNESFAVYISHYCLEKLEKTGLELGFCNSMVRMFFYKRDGYEEDCLDSTTHPIKQNIESTEKCNDIFNSITYAKGAAVIKQLMFLINEEQFSECLKIYFEKFKWNNADLNDLFDIIDQKVTHFNVHNWKNQWLESASLNQIEIKEIKKEGFIVIEQNPISSLYPKLRSHCFKIGIFLQDTNGILNEKIFTSSIENAENIVFVGNEILDFLNSQNEYGILLNYGDHGYFKALLDPVSSDFFRKNINRIEDKLSKAQLLLIFYDMIYELQLSPLEFLEIAKEILLFEDNLQLFSQTLNYAFRTLENYIPRDLKEEESSKIFEIVLGFLMIPTCSQSKMLVLKEYIGIFARKKEDIKVLVDILLKRNVNLAHVTANSYILTQAIELIFFKKLLSEQERTELFKRYVENNRYYKLFCENALLNINKKEEIWKEFLFCPSNESVYLRSFAMKGFNNEYDDKSLEFVENKFFDNIEQVFNSGNRQYSKTFFRKLYPKNENFDWQISKIEEICKRENDPYLVFLLKEKLQITIQRKKVMKYYFSK